MGHDNISNILAAVACANILNIHPMKIKEGIEKLNLPNKLDAFLVPTDGQNHSCNWWLFFDQYSKVYRSPSTRSSVLVCQETPWTRLERVWVELLGLVQREQRESL